MGEPATRSFGAVDGLFESAADQTVDHVVADAGAMAALEHRQRRLAGTKAGDLGRAAHALQLRLDFLFDFGDRDGQINTALQAGEGFNHRLH